MRLKNVYAAIAILFFAVPAFAASQAKKLPARCDRACLTGAMNDYVAALVAHDPSRVPLSPHVEFVENTVPMHPGDGLWKTAEAPPATFKIYVPDPVSEEVFLLCVMQANHEPIEAGFRLKIRQGEIVAAEHLWADQITPAASKNLQTPRPAFLANVPPAERNTRADMLKIAPTYYTAVTTADSNNAPFADDCERHENGIPTTGIAPPPNPTPRQVLGSLGCAAQLKAHVMDYIKRIEPRRVMIADPQTGLVVGFSQFRHPMDEKTEKIVGVPGMTSRTMDFKPFDNVAVHIFKVFGGKIHEIEALGHSGMPYDSPTGWESFPDHGR
ncbi:MAG TPA: hypothetical protein VHX36_01495 [Candidatus Acidoferrales bacterium]|jgi:hypothetical protein|nr:hypothetical protein [Candidatus Acidoferrales bacterium]